MKRILSTKFKNEILNLFNKGFSGKQIATIMRDEYYSETGKQLTRNVCRGIQFRAGKCDPMNYGLSIKNRMSRVIVPTKGFKLKKCLACKKEVYIEEHLRICPNCTSERQKIDKSQWDSSIVGRTQKEVKQILKGLL